MNETIVVEFSKRTKKRVICILVFLLFFLPAMYLKYISDTEIVFGFEKVNFVIALQLLAVIPIIWSIKYYKCPACNKTAGFGWNIRQCEHCGEKLS